MATMALRVVVADDSLLVREGVVSLLQAAGFDVVAQAGDPEALMDAVRAHRPDVAVVDIRMPPTHSDEGVRAARAIRAEAPGTGVLVLSQHVEEEYAVTLLSGSAEGVGYLLKDRVLDGRSLVTAVRQVAAGGSALDPEVVAQMLDRPREPGPLDRLSDRERAVARQVSSIFAKLDLPAGAEGHRRVLAVLTYLRA